MSYQFPPLSAFLMVFTIYVFPDIAVASTEQEVFRQGIEAARSGDFPTALEAFKRANELGLQSAALYYNLAVSYYRLEKYELAYDSFSRLTNHANLAGVAAYNLGLTSEKLQQKEEARRWFSIVPSLSNDQALIKLSENALQTLDREAKLQMTRITPPKPSRWNGMLSLEIARNDNIGLDPDIRNLPRDSQQAGTSAELLLTASGYLAGNSRHGLRVSGSIDRLNYAKKAYIDANGNAANASDFNSGLTQLSLSYDNKLKGWRNRLSAIGGTSQLGGEDFQKTLGYELRTGRYFSKYLRLRIRYRYTDITSQAAVYNHLEGDKKRLRIDLRLTSFKRRPGNEKIRLSFIGEKNNRKQARSSPDRRAVRLAIDAPLGDTSLLSFTFAYRFSRYKNMDPRPQREDDRFRIGLEFGYTGIKRFVLYVGALQTQNQNETPEYSSFNYEENIFYTGVNWYY